MNDENVTSHGGISYTNVPNFTQSSSHGHQLRVNISSLTCNQGQRQESSNVESEMESLLPFTSSTTRRSATFGGLQKNYHNETNHEICNQIFQTVPWKKRPLSRNMTNFNLFKKKKPENSICTSKLLRPIDSSQELSSVTTTSPLTNTDIHGNHPSTNTIIENEKPPSPYCFAREGSLNSLTKSRRKRQDHAENVLDLLTLSPIPKIRSDPRASAWGAPEPFLLRPRKLSQTCFRQPSLTQSNRKSMLSNNLEEKTQEPGNAQVAASNFCNSGLNPLPSLRQLFRDNFSQSERLNESTNDVFHTHPRLTSTHSLDIRKLCNNDLANECNQSSLWRSPLKEDGPKASKFFGQYQNRTTGLLNKIEHQRCFASTDQKKRQTARDSSETRQVFEPLLNSSNKRSFDNIPIISGISRNTPLEVEMSEPNKNNSCSFKPISYIEAGQSVHSSLSHLISEYRLQCFSQSVETKPVRPPCDTEVLNYVPALNNQTSLNKSDKILDGTRTTTMIKNQQLKKHSNQQIFWNDPIIGTTISGNSIHVDENDSNKANDETTKSKAKFSKIDSHVSHTSHSQTEDIIDPSQLGTRFIKDIPVCHGIPLAIIRRQLSWTTLISWIIVMCVVAWGFSKYIDWYIVNDFVELPHSGINATLDMKNCVTSFTAAEGSQSYVMVRAWMSRSEEFDWVGDIQALKTPYSWRKVSEWFVKLKMSHYNLYFQCVVRFHLTPDFQFDRLLVSYEPDVGYVDISSSIPIRANSIIIDAFHAFIHLKSLESKRIRIHLGDGTLKLALDGHQGGYDFQSKDSIIINSRVAAVTLETSIPLDITMTNDVAARSFLRGAGISVTETSSDKMTAVVYSSEFSSFSAVFNSISVQMLGIEAPLYVTGRKQSEDAGSLELHTWAGVEQIADPHFLPTSVRRISSIRPWINYAPNAPWTVVTQLSGEYLPQGLWKFLSSDAFLGSNNCSRGRWFMIFAACWFFFPQLHMMGLYCRRRNGKPLEDELGYILTDTEDEENDLMKSNSMVIERRLLQNESIGGNPPHKNQKETDNKADLSLRRKQRILEDMRKLQGNREHFRNYKRNGSRILNVAKDPEVIPAKATKTIVTHCDFNSTFCGEQNFVKGNHSLNNHQNGLRTLKWMFMLSPTANAPHCDGSVSVEKPFPVEVITVNTWKGYKRQSQNELKERLLSSTKIQNDTHNFTLMENHEERQRQLSESGSIENHEIHHFSPLAKTSPGMDIGMIPSFTSCPTEILEDMFIVTWRTFKEIRAPYILPVWMDLKTGKEILFDIQNDAVVKTIASWRDTWMFGIAIGINIFSSILVAVVGAISLHQALEEEYMKGILTGDPLARNVSHRLDNEVTKRPVESWKPQVTRLHGRCEAEGFMIRWTQAYAGLSITQLGVHISPVYDPLKHKSSYQRGSLQSTDDIFIYFPIDIVKKVETDAGLQNELQVPLLYPSKSWRRKVNKRLHQMVFWSSEEVWLETDQSWSLRHDIKYRFKLLGVNSAGRLVAQSSWSPEIAIGEFTDNIDLPFWLCRKFCPTRHSTLKVFLSKYVQQQSPFKLPINMMDLSIEIFTSYCGGPRDETMNPKRVGLSYRADTFNGKELPFLLRSSPFRKIPLLAGSKTNQNLFHRKASTKQWPKPGWCCHNDPSEEEITLLSDLESPEIGDKKTAKNSLPWQETNLNVRAAVELSSVELALTAFLGTKNDVAKQMRDASGRCVWDRTIIAGRPEPVEGGRQGSIRISSTAPLYLEHDRDSQKSVCFEAANSLTGNLIAFGSISMEAVQQELLARSLNQSSGNSTVMTVNLDSAAGGKQWGRIQCRLDASALQPFVRHRETSQFGNQRDFFSPTLRPLDIKQRHNSIGFGDAAVSRQGTCSALLPLERMQSYFDWPDVNSPVAGGAPRFIRDIPARKHLLGSDMIIQWQWNTNDKPDHIYFHLMDHKTDRYILSMHFGRAIPNTGSYSWPVDVHFEKGLNYRVVYLVMTLERYTGKINVPVICQSNAFFIVKTLPLCELELAYAAFCRSSGVEMEHMSETVLASCGVAVIEKNIRICPDLRNPLPFEPSSECVYCPGQCIVSNTSKLVQLSDHSDFGLNYKQTAGRQSIELPTIHQVNVYKSINKRIKIVENCVLDPDPYWWSESPDLLFLSQQVLYGNRMTIRLFYMLLNFSLRALSMKSPMIHEETHYTFCCRRYLSFKIWAVVLNSVFVMSSIVLYLLFPLTICAIVGVYNYLLTDFSNIDHRDINQNFLSDIVFARSFLFFFKLPFPIPHLLIWVLLEGGLHMWHIFFSRILRYNGPQGLRLASIRFICFSEVVRSFTVIWVVTSFFLWFLVGALINSDAFLPYAVMLGSVIFVVYTLWNNYSSSRKLVSKFIEDNLQRLVALAIDNWFENLNLEFRDSKQHDDDQGRLQYKDDIRRELRDVRERERHEFRMGLIEGDETIAATAVYQKGIGGHTDEFGGNAAESGLFRGQTRFRRVKNQLCSWSYEKRAASTENVFEFDSTGKPKGLESEEYLASGARWVTVSDVERNRSSLEGLLFGYEAAMLEDGAFYGPRYGYKIDPDPQPGQEFSFALIAIPQYPPAEDLDAQTKLLMVFDYFDKDQDDHLNQNEFQMWQTTTKKIQKSTWEATLNYYSTHHNVDINKAKGATTRDLERYYKNIVELDNDYELLYPTGRQDDGNGSYDDASRSESLMFESDIEDDISDSGSTNGHDEEEPTPLTDAQIQDEKMEETLRTNLNARKLQTIFSVVTKEHRGRQVEEVITSTSFLAAKIVETQFRLLSPTFGRECVLDSPGCMVQHRRGSVKNNVRNDLERITQLVQLIQLDLRSELLKQCRLTFLHMFDPAIVRAGVSQFYDNVIVDKIQIKAHRLLNQRLDITPSDVHPSNVTELFSLPPKTAAHALRFIENYRIQHDKELKEQMAMQSKAGALQITLEVSLVTRVFYEAKILKEAQVTVELLEVQSAMRGNNDLDVIELFLPARRECYNVIVQSVDGGKGILNLSNIASPNLSTTSITDHLPATVRNIVTKFLWFDAFVLLVRLLGINLSTDELPGSALVPVEETGQLSPYGGNIFESPEKEWNTGDIATGEKRRTREQRNLKRIEQVFTQLSNNSCFLPVDLADEAILLLTDNRMNFSSVIACLQHLGIDSVGVHANDHIPTALEQLGIFSASPVIDIEGSGDEHAEDVFDWTELRGSPGWSKDLFLAFNRLISASPGFMGKSQMIEFIKEIQRSFEPEELYARDSECRKINFAGTVDIDSRRMISFEIFHRVASRSGLSIGLQHSRIIWVLINSENREATPRFMVADEAFEHLIRFYLQPFNASGERCSQQNEPTANVHRYHGFITQQIFKKLVRLMGVNVADKGIQGMWEELNKDPLDISTFLPPLKKEEYSTTKFLRLEMDKTGLDPTKGKVVRIESLRRQLPRMLMTGLWPEAVKSLIKLSLQIEVNPSLLEVVLDKFQRKTNYFGLIKPEDVAAILTNLNVAGMSYPMLKEIVDKMRLNLPDSRIRTMFNLMDVNHDKSLDLPELLGGFELLFGKLIPDLLFEAVGVSSQHQLKVIVTSLLGLIIFFIFIGLAFSSFVGMSSNASTAMQSILAFVGAISLQSGAKQDARKVEEGMRNRMGAILGDGFDKRLREQQANESSLHQKEEQDHWTKQTWEGKVTKIKYSVPKKFRPELDDPKPCVSFCAGDSVKLVPLVSGHVDVDKLRWTITPRLPEKTGLIFDTKTGIIEGIISPDDDHQLGLEMFVDKLLHQQQQLQRYRSNVETERATSTRKPPAPCSKCSFDSLTRLSSSISDTDISNQTHETTPLKSFGSHKAEGKNCERVRRKFHMPRKTFTVISRNSVGSTRTRVTFQILPERRHIHAHDNKHFRSTVTTQTKHASQISQSRSPTDSSSRSVVPSPFERNTLPA